MKTIKDFKDAGLVFVKGDSGSGFTVGDAEGFNLDNIWDYLKPESFAWRTNTGVKPEFDGVVEVEVRNGGLGVAHPNSLQWGVNIMDISSPIDIIKWRPHLPKVEDKPKSPYDVGAHVSETKPAFTQAMDDIETGFKLEFDKDINGEFDWLHGEIYGWEVGDQLEVIHKTENHHGEPCCIVLNCQSDVLTTAAISDASFFDTRTDSEKAIEEMVECLGLKGDNVVGLNIAKRLYAAGYRLQTPKNNVT